MTDNENETRTARTRSTAGTERSEDTARNAKRSQGARSTEGTVMSVYLICHEGSEIGKDVYVGSTSQSLTARLSAHKSSASRPGGKNNKFYKRMREVGLKNWVIRPLLSLESTICSHDDIRKLERAWCEKLRSDLNTCLPFQTDKKNGPTMQTVYLVHNKKSETGKDSYVGSTSKSLATRLSCHKSNAYRPGNVENKFYKRMREVSPENWEIVPLLTLKCSSKEIRALERGWCETLGADLNTHSPLMTAEEANQRYAKYRARNREQKKFFCEVCEASEILRRSE